MKVKITDHNAFNSIDPKLAERYLRANGWNEQHKLDSGVSIWNYSNGNKYRLWLPFNPKLADYAQIMGRAVKVLAEVDNKTELQIFEDLNTVAIGDVIRLVDHDPLNREGSTLPLTDGENLIQKGRDMSIAAAMSEATPREVHPNSRPLNVRSFADNLRLAQSEPGSYTVKIISPVKIEETEVKKDNEDQAELLEVPAIPFSRKAIERLVKSLETLKDIGQEANKKGMYYFQPFRESIHYGISANMCEAVASSGKDSPNKPLVVSITWSSVLPETKVANSPVDIEIPAIYMTYYQQAAEEFRQVNPLPRTINGYVKVLDKDRGSEEGTVSIITTINGVQAVVRVELSGQDYSTAVQAHDNDLFVNVEGDLVKRGRFRWLNNPSNIYVIETPQLPI